MIATAVSPAVAKVYLLLSHFLLVHFIFQKNIPLLQNKQSWNYLYKMCINPFKTEFIRMCLGMTIDGVWIGDSIY
jgi:hypothetical protein